MNPPTSAPEQTQIPTVNATVLPSTYPPPWIQEPEETSLIDLLVIFFRNLWKVLLFCMLSVGLVFFYTKKQPKTYRAEAAIAPVGSDRSPLAALSSQLSSIPLLGQLASGMGGSTKSPQLIGFLKSRTLVEKIVDRFDLLKILFASQWDAKSNSWTPDIFGRIPIKEDAVLKIQKKVLKIEEDKKTAQIKIQFSLSENPKEPSFLPQEVAAKIINEGFLVELQDFIQQNQLTSAKRNRIFIEEQLQKNRIALLESSKKLNRFYAQNVSSTHPEVDVWIGKIPQLPQTLEEFRAFQKTNQKSAESAPETQEMAVVENVPSQVYLQYLTAELELLGKANALLSQQYEVAKIEEIKEDLSFQIIDKAVAPIRPSGPSLLINLGIGGLGSFFIGTFFVFFAEAWKKQRRKGLPNK